VETRSALSGLKHQKEKRSMDHFAGLDVSVKETSVCIGSLRAASDPLFALLSSMVFLLAI
jgi:hypothetical protein